MRKTTIELTEEKYELIYADKEREEDILADTMAVPLQKIKTFRNGKNGNGWTNMLIFGDNLQVLKTLLQMKQEGKLKNADGTPGVRLVYIDPPFATGQEFRGKQGQKTYQDKIAGAKFLEFLRKRLIFLRELLSEDGSIYVHLDWKKGHYVKILMDEVLGEQNFRNDIIVKRIKRNYVKKGEKVRKLDTGHDVILFFARSENHFIIPPIRLKPREKRWHSFGTTGIRGGRDYELFGYKPGRTSHWRWTKERAEKAIAEGSLRPNPNTGKPEYLIEKREEEVIDTIWNDVNAYSVTPDYPTEKSETLIYRIIRASSNPGDLVLDCFAGSGTTLAVAEKLGRHWIGVDCGKLSIYTMQKRLLNIAESKDLENPKKKYGKLCKPFTLYNAGLYDTVDAAGFDFIQTPTVECKYFIDDKKGQLELGKVTKEFVIKIERFESKVISRKPLEFANLETLSMVMLDYDFNGEVFDLDKVFYVDDLKKNGYEVRFAEDKVKKQIMVIYIDIFGNEKWETKTLSELDDKLRKAGMISEGQ